MAERVQNVTSTLDVPPRTTTRFVVTHNIALSQLLLGKIKHSKVDNISLPRLRKKAAAIKAGESNDEGKEEEKLVEEVTVEQPLQ